jgi:serine/threonine protein kinase
MSDDAEARFAQWVEHHVFHDAELDPATLCADRPDLIPELQALIAQYRQASDSLEGLPRHVGRGAEPASTALPVFEGFRTIERIGMGGMGDVYKLHDLKLDRLVAAKIVRGDGRMASGLAGFLSEARALALFQDRRIVQIHEFRDRATPPVIIMEYVDGFELGRLAPSLEFHQRARIIKEVCEAVHHAHQVGVQHRDLKPSNIMLDGELRPKILDFGLSSNDPARGHFRGTPRYLAPEQLDTAQPIDARTDVYALGAVLYELLCGVPPVDGANDDDIVANVHAGAIRLPVEIAPRTPEPLQAIALKALETRPADRYQSAHEMALDLGRYLEGRPVTVRPSRYSTVLTARVKPHLDQVEDWLRLKLIYPHEATRLQGAYRHLDKHDDDWIGESRLLSYSQIALYLGAFLLLCGSLFYFNAHQVKNQAKGLLQPLVVLALPFAVLNGAASTLAKRGYKAVSVAFYLGGVSLLPLFLLILFHDAGLFVVAGNTPGELFQGGSVSNTQMQISVFMAWAWAAWLAFRTRTIALSTIFAVLALLFTLAVLSDYGLRQWVEDQQWDQLALHLLPLVPVYAALGLGLEKTGRPWFGRPLYTGAGVLLIVALELLALDGRMFQYLHLDMRPFLGKGVSDSLVLNTVAALSLNGMLFHAVALAADRYGTDLMKTAAWLLFTISPFAILEPLAYLSETQEYSRAFDWIYLALALVISILSHQRQRKSFYYAGLLNTGVALWFIADHYEWFDNPGWAIVLVAIGLAGLVAGLGLDARERRSARPGA